MRSSSQKVDYHRLPKLRIGLLLLLYTLIADQIGVSAELMEYIEKSPIQVVQESDNPEANNKILVEIFLGSDRRNDLETIKKAFEAVSVTRIRVQFFRLGNPPTNIAIGNNVPAPVARLAIRLAVTYNRDVKSLLPQFRFFPDHIAIGTSAFDEKSEIPIRPDDLKRLSDPALTTAQFHALYRHLTGEDERNPTYLDKGKTQGS
ncbi:MAG: hypothetical protein HY204_04685 [Nitrospirae bacterium]|nr:hypothetical protein [Nitrospirota bacterium]